MQSLKLKLDVTKLDKSAFFKGEKGTYCDLILWANDEPDQWGNTHSVKQDMGKDRKGEKTPYVGNAKPIGQAKPAQRQAPQARADAWDDPESDRVPF